jgi:hypothetical protein
MGMDSNTLNPRRISLKLPRGRRRICSGLSVIGAILMSQPDIGGLKTSSGATASGCPLVTTGIDADHRGRRFAGVLGVFAKAGQLR